MKSGGIGRHIAVVLEIHPEKVVILEKLEIAYEVCYILAVTFPKLSMLCLFLRIFVTRWSRNGCYMLIAFLSLTAFANITVAILQCIPLHRAWDPASGGHCINQNAWWCWGSLPNIISDILIIALPFPVIAKSQISWKDKIGIAVTFTVGSM